MSDPDEYPHRLCVPSDPDTTGRNTEGVCEPGSAGQPAAQIAALMPLARAATHAGSAAVGTPPSRVERPTSITWNPGASVAPWRRRRRLRGVPPFRGNPERIQTPRPRQAPALPTLLHPAMTGETQWWYFDNQRQDSPPRDEARLLTRTPSPRRMATPSRTPSRQ